MIETFKIWERLNILTKGGTSGYTSEEDFNSDLYSVQFQVLNLLCDNYEKSQKVSDALINHIITEREISDNIGKINVYNEGTANTPSDGTLSKYHRVLSVLYIDESNTYPTTKINTNEKADYLISPIRGVSLAKKRVAYYFADKSLRLLPETALTVDIIYCKKPALAKLKLTQASSSDSDYLTLDVGQTVNIDFPEGLFNLFVFMMLECRGIEQKENLLSQYSQLGIQRAVKTDIA